MIPVCCRFFVIAILIAVGFRSAFARAQDNSIFHVPRSISEDPNANPQPATPPTTQPDSAVTLPDDKSVVRTIVISADDFVMDIYVNGQKVPQQNRKLINDLYGAQAERDSISLKPGDWIVFNCACNQLRWSGTCYLAAAGLDGNGNIVFQTDIDSGNWSACDEIRDVPKFLADPRFGIDQKVVEPPRLTKRSDKIIKDKVPGWSGHLIWGNSHNTWIKFTVLADAPK